MHFSELRLSDLGGLVNLLHQIANFKSKVMGASLTAPENVFRECIKGSGTSNFGVIIYAADSKLVVFKSQYKRVRVQHTLTSSTTVTSCMHASSAKTRTRRRRIKKDPVPSHLTFGSNFALYQVFNPYYIVGRSRYFSIHY